jgi:hypothetical protein
MTFQIGKFYKAGSKTENYTEGEKLLCVHILKKGGKVIFFSEETMTNSVEYQDSCEDFTEWREPREFTLLRNNLGYYQYTPQLNLEPGETIKLREVL